MNHASVFSGIGGPEVAAAMLGWRNLFHCEINPFGRRVLNYWFPESKSYEDITKTDFTEWRGRVDVLTGGFPCQPFSYAGQRRGATDDRYLWPSMFRCIDEVQPRWVVAENVAGVTTMVEQGQVSQMASQTAMFDEDNHIRRYELRETFTIERICRDLENHGYAVQPLLIPACAVGAPHRRDRVFIVAHAVGSGTGAPRTSGKTESNGRDTDKQPCAGRTTAEWANRLYAILRNAADADCNRQPAPNGQNRRTRQTLDEERKSQPLNGNCGRSNDVSRPADAVSENTLRNGRESGHTQKQGREWNFGDAGARNREWFCGETQGTENTDFVGKRWATFPTVAAVHRGNDGLPFDVDHLTVSFNKWRNESLKAYGNAIVPQVIYEIFRAIEIVEIQLINQSINQK